MHSHYFGIRWDLVYFGGFRSIGGDRGSWWERLRAGLRSIGGDRWSRWEGPGTSVIKSIIFPWFYSMLLVPHAFRWWSWWTLVLHKLMCLVNNGCLDVVFFVCDCVIIIHVLSELLFLDYHSCCDCVIIIYVSVFSPLSYLLGFMVCFAHVISRIEVRCSSEMVVASRRLLSFVYSSFRIRMLWSVTLGIRAFVCITLICLKSTIMRFWLWCIN